MTDDGDVASEAVDITRMDLRGGGWIGYSDEAVFVEDGEDRVKVTQEHVEQLALRTLEFDVAIMSLLLIGVGAWVVLNRNPLVGLGFAVLGVYSLYHTYRQRHELVIEVKNEPKPLSVHPVHPSECHEALVEQIRSA